MAEPFDVQALWAALDQQRGALALSWASVGRATGVSPSTLTRTEHATDLEADGMIQMTLWLGVAPESFCTSVAGLASEVVPDADEGIVRVDTAALHGALDDRRTADGLSWADLAAALESDRATPDALRGLRRGGRVSAQVLLSATRWLGLPTSRFLHVRAR